MVIDSDNTSFFGTTANNSRGARNTLMHEIGHGVGIDHVESTPSQFLMNPFINTSFDGPQFDDILAIQRGYGDVLEKGTGNNVSANSTDLGTISSGSTVSRGTSTPNTTAIIDGAAVDFVSIDDESDLDFFKFTVTTASAATLTLTPKGPTYTEAPQTNPPTTQTSFNGAAQSDLTLQLIDTNGTTVLNTANANGLGGSEVVTGPNLPAGTYFARVNGATTNKIQLYQLDVNATSNTNLVSANDNSGTTGNGAGNGTPDSFLIRRNVAGTMLEVLANGVLAGTFDITTAIQVNGSSDNDILTLDYANGVALPTGGLTFVGSTGTNSMSVSGSGITTGSYAPSSTTDGTGTLTLDGRNAAFSGLSPLTVSGVTNFTFTTPNSADTLSIDSPAAGQNRISGTSGGVGFEALTFFDITNLTIDAATNDGVGGGSGDDAVSIDASLVATGLSSLTINTGTAGSGFSGVSAAVNLPGNFSFTAENLTVGGGVTTTGNGAITLQASSSLTGLIVSESLSSVSGAISLNSRFDIIATAGGAISTTSGLVSFIADSDTNLSGTIMYAGAVNHGSNGSTWSLADTTGEMSAAISGSGGLTKLGVGTLKLGAANTFTGVTAINGGRLNVNGALADGGAVTDVTVASGTTLGGTGTVSGAVSVSNGGKIAPGTSPGILNSGSVTFVSGSTFEVEVGGTTVGNAATNHDQLNVTGTVDLGGATLTTAQFNGFVPVAGNTFTIIANDSNDAITGTFNGLAEGAIVSANFLGSGLSATISYIGGTGNDVVLTVISGETGVVLSGGNLVITDGNGGTSNDTLTISLNGANVRLNDPSNTLSAGAGMSQVNANTVDVPLASITGNIQFAALAGNDTLTIDFSGGNPIPSGGISFAGGTQTTSDQLIVTGGTTTTVTNSFTNANDGSVTLVGALAGTISYTGLEPVTDNLSATDRVFTFTGGAETITVTDNIASDGKTLIDSTLGESVYFTNPTGSLTINAGTGADIVTVTSVDAGYNVDLTINGDAGNDTVNLNSDITFASGESLNVNLTNDASGGDLDAITVGAGTNLITSGTGSISLQSSGAFSVPGGGSLETVNGGITVAANAAGTSGTDFSGITLIGMIISTSGTGNISLIGTSGIVTGVGGAGIKSFGSIIRSLLSGAGAGTISLTGIARGGTSVNIGVRVASNTLITSVSGAIAITGTGSATATSSDNFGVQIANSSDITSTGIGANAATITIIGTGGTSSGSGAGNHFGVKLDDSGTTVTSIDGTVSIIGQGGNEPTATQGTGVVVEDSALLETTGTANVTVTGTAGAGTSLGMGVDLFNSTVRTSGSGDITLIGTGDTVGGSGSEDYGILLESSALVTSTSSGDITLRGIGGTANSSANTGVSIGRPGGLSIGSVTSTSSGTITIQAKKATGNASFGIHLVQTGSTITSSGSGAVTLASDSIRLETNTTIAAAANIVTLRPATTTDIASDDNGDTISIGANGADTGTTLELSDGELDIITAGRIVIGNSSAGAVTFNAAVAMANSNVLEVITGSTINDDGAAGTFTDTSLALNAATGVGTSSTLNVAVSNLAATTATGGINVTNTGAVSLTTVGGVTGVSTTTSGNVSIAATGSITVSQPVNVVGAGTLLLDAQNATTGDIIVNNTVTTGTGSLTLRADDDITSNTSGTLTTTSGAVVLTADDDVNASGTFTYTAAVNHGSTGSTWSLADADGSMSGIISGSGGLTKNGNGTLALSGTSANTFTGTTTVNTGTLSLNKTAGLNAIGGALTIGNGSATDTVKLLAANQIPDTTDVSIATGGVFDLNARLETIDALTGTGSVTSSVAGAVTLTIGANNDPTPSFSGVISNGSGTVALTKTGSGTQSLSGANTYTGATTVSGGRLNVNGSTAAGSAVTVQSTGTLGGTGTVADTVNVQSGGTVAPGTSPGILNSGSVTFVSSSTFAVEIAGDDGAGAADGHDQLNVTGTVTLGSATLTLDLTCLTAAEIPVGQTFLIVNNDSTEAISGTFNGFAEGATVLSNVAGTGRDLRISYVGGTDSNDVVLTVVVVETSVALSGGNLIITDGNGGTSNDTLTLSINGTNVRVSDPNIALTAGACTTQFDANTVDVPLASITGNIQVNTLAGNDSLTIDLSGGNFSDAIVIRRWHADDE